MTKGSRGDSVTSIARSTSSDSVTNLKLLPLVADLADISSSGHSQRQQKFGKERNVSESTNTSYRSHCNSLPGTVWESSFEEFCRICHENGEEETLLAACRCNGSIRFVHHRCLLNWISRSGELVCELCKYDYKVTRTSQIRFSQWQLPAIGIQGWLHIVLFFAFLSMLLTSITWVIWSQTSRSSAAVFERSSPEIKYAYLLNGIFILTAVIGISLDSFRQARKYFQRSLAMNQEITVLEYNDEDDDDKKFNGFNDTDVESLIPRTDRLFSTTSKKEDKKRVSINSSLEMSEQSVYVEIDLLDDGSDNDYDNTASTFMSCSGDESKLCTTGYESLHNLEETCI